MIGYNQVTEMRGRIIDLVNASKGKEDIIKLYLHLFGKDDELYRDYRASQEVD